MAYRVMQGIIVEAFGALDDMCGGIEQLRIAIELLADLLDYDIYALFHSSEAPFF